MLLLSSIRIDCGTQSRAEVNQSVVDEYAEAIQNGERLPAITVFWDKTHYYLADGFHRYFAHKKLGQTEIVADVVAGSLRDAIHYAVGANAAHGLRRTNADKRRAVMMLLDDFETADWPDREIARLTKTSHAFVGQVRKEMGEPEPAKEKAKPTPQEDPEGTEEGALEALQDENRKLADELAATQLCGTEEEKEKARQMIAELRDQIQLLEVELTAVKQSRDQFQAENAKLKRQLETWKKKFQQTKSEN